ncbi:MAG: 50S ribosomal protein L17 [candidate division WS6 bacterium GW2011_GWE1_34_7]|uniref:50S ribosomal protein L17 n=1 Tax=candidate division WS6 bacterium GW2011_GWE1_34_7 TaxID=1619093 RepID=A0A0G0B397_9BACT|nr:MAG: 50S ribosomal protein L17 [candidate division WS6 bacterium GW2011_GWE1_34_7]
MYKRNSIKKLGRKSSHRKALVKNLLRSIMQSGKVNTSSVKAKVLRGELTSVLSKAKNSDEKDISLKRDMLTIFGNKELVKKVFEIAKKESTKVSIKKVGFRAGDNTEMSLVEISGFKIKSKSKKQSKKEEKEEKEEKVEIKKVEEKKRGILNLGRKNVSKEVTTVKKERARSRSGL